MNGLLVRPAEAARMLSVSRTVLYSFLSTGEIRSLKIGQSRLIAVAEPQRWIEQRQQAEEAR